MSTQSLEYAVAKVKQLEAQVAGWKRTALAMRDLAISWDHYPQDSECDRIQDLYFNAAMKGEFAP